MIAVPFAPSRGGVQTVVELLATALTEKSHDVCVATQQTSGKPDNFSFKVLRCPRFLELFLAYWKTDQIILHGPAIRLGWPLFLIPCRAWMVHHMWPEKETNFIAPFLRKLLEWRCRHLSVSHALGRSFKAPYKIITNPYDHLHYKQVIPLNRNRDLIFVGRLIRDKGADILIDSLAILRTRGLYPSAIFVGAGKELESLQRQATGHSLQTQVTFVGEKSKGELLPLLNSHRIMVVPSRWEEPFGIVVLEGLACGCEIVASETGGLPDAVGPCGFLFERGNANALADCLETILQNKADTNTKRSFRTAHLTKHTPSVVADRYLEILIRD